MSCGISQDFIDSNFHKIFAKLIADIEHEILSYKKQLSKDFSQEKNNLVANYLHNIFKVCFERIDIAFGVLLLSQAGKHFSKNKDHEKTTPRNDELLPLIENIRKSDEFLNKETHYSPTISVCAQKFLTLLHRLEVIATYDVLMQITREMAKDRVLHRMYKTNEQNHFENEKLEELIRNKKEVLEYEENTKRKAREAHERDIDKLISVNAKEIRNNIEQSYKKTKSLYNRMRCEEEAAHKKLSENTELNRLSEQMMRKFEMQEKQKKTQLEEQMLNALRKYDNEISARCYKLEKLNTILKNNTQVLNRWQHKYEKQVAIYRHIVAEIEAEEIRIREEKLLLFMMNRSAVIIQRAFREILSKKKSKRKKGKKGRK